MAFWVIAALIFGGTLVAAFGAPRPKAVNRPLSPDPDEEALWTPDAVARLGTPETVADLVAQGRADELQGLGYSGDLPDS
jgi:hypothetical protein